MHYNSNRLGIRLQGPRPQFARPDGGEGGSHPSNVHDHVYAIGTINFTGTASRLSHYHYRVTVTLAAKLASTALCLLHIALVLLSCCTGVLIATLACTMSSAHEMHAVHAVHAVRAASHEAQRVSFFRCSGTCACHRHYCDAVVVNSILPLANALLHGVNMCCICCAEHSMCR